MKYKISVSILQKKKKNSLLARYEDWHISAVVVIENYLL